MNKNLYKQLGINPKTMKPGDLITKHKAWSEAKDDAYDRKHGIKEDSKEDKALDAKRGLKHKTMCKMCGKAHAMKDHYADDKKQKKHHKGLKLNPPSKGHKPKGAHGRAAVAQLGRTKTTGNFARIERARGKGAAIAAFQNARKAFQGK